jgi:PHD/YefM family antitoxin component YafN of YafNO toxin-antitoxin module
MPADQHPLMQTALLVRLSQPLEERLAVYLQRKKALRHLQRIREQLAADPTATEDDLETLDRFIGWKQEELDAYDKQDERRRTKTRERVARWRARKAGERAPARKRT